MRPRDGDVLSCVMKLLRSHPLTTPAFFERIGGQAAPPLQAT